MRIQTVVLRDLFLIGVDLRLFRPFKIPRRIWRKGVRVKRAGNITLCAGIAILTPCPADIIGFFGNDKIVIAAGFELRAHTDATKAGSDNECLTIWMSHALTIALQKGAARVKTSPFLMGPNSN